MQTDLWEPFKKAMSIGAAWCAVIGPYIFFSLLGAAGVSYEGRSSSASYIFFSAASACLIGFLYLVSIFRRERCRRADGFLFFVLSAFSIHLLALSLTAIDPEPGLITFVNWFVLGIPGALAYMYLRRVGHLQAFIRSSSIVALLLLILLVRSTFGELIQGNRSVEIGGATYQNFSYIAATSFAIFVINADIKVSAPSGRQKSHVGLLRVVGLSIASLVAVALVVLGGGRGAMITVIAFSLVFFIRAIRSLQLRNLTHASLALLSVGAASAVVVSKLSPSWVGVFEFGFRRAFSYLLDGDGSLGDGTGGRSEIYHQAAALLSASPLYGYGVFGVHGTLIHPHNIALEWGLQFGLPVAAVLIVWMMWCFVAAIRSNDEVRRWCCQFLAIGLIMLSFSGSYLETGLFWFGVAALLDQSRNRHPGSRLRATP